MRWRFPLVVCPLAAIALGSGVKAEAVQYEVVSAQDLWFSFAEPMEFTVRTDAIRFGIDSMLWLYDGDGVLVAWNDDYFGLDSFLSVPVVGGSYRLRTGVCCGDPNWWYGSGYLVEVNATALPGEPVPVPPTTSTSSTSTTTSTTTEPPVTTTEPPPTTTEPVVTEPPTTTEVPATTVPDPVVSSVPDATDPPSEVVPTTVVVESPTTVSSSSVPANPTTTVPVTIQPVVPVVVVTSVPPPVVPVTEVVPVVVNTDPPLSDGSEPPFTVGGDDNEESAFVPVSNGLREGVTAEQQRVVVATSILSVMPVFRPTNATAGGSQRSSQRRKESE